MRHRNCPPLHIHGILKVLLYTLHLAVQHGAQALKEDRRRTEEIEALLLLKLERWEELEAMAKAGVS